MANTRSIRSRVLKRFIGMELGQFDAFFADSAVTALEDAAYPPFCLATSGPVRFRHVKAGGVIVDVRRCEARPSGDFRLDMLFATGSSPFADAIDLARFWNGPLADSFGLQRGPLPERGQQSLLDDLHDALPPPAPTQPAPPVVARPAGCLRLMPWPSGSARRFVDRKRPFVGLRRSWSLNLQSGLPAVRPRRC